jgi:heptose I phosphotransferase
VIFELDSSIASFFPGKAEGFDAVMRLEGERYRHLDGRTTARVMIGGLAYFIKQHRGVGWREIFKNLVQGRLPILGARDEVLALKRLATLGVPAPRVLGYGERGFNPATRESFIIMEALDNTISLETLCADWVNNPPRFEFKQAVIAAVAQVARLLHTHGMNHRDFYLCHFLLEKTCVDQRPLCLFLIDLHRAAIRKTTPSRWVNKDLAGLYFSSKGIGLTSRDYYRFMKVYRLQSLREMLTSERQHWEHIKSLGEKLYREHF